VTFELPETRPLHGLGFTAIAAVGLFTAAKVLEWVLDLTSGVDPADPTGGSVHPTVLFSLATAGLAAVAVLLWLYRARRNLDTFDDAEPRWSAGWTVGALFIPCANIILVPVVLADVARWSLAGDAGRRRVVFGLIWGSLACYLLGSFTGGLLSAFTQASGPSTAAGWAGLALTVAGGMMLMAVIHAVTAAQQDRVYATTG
jgi:hypothetical protein